jgi:hypothetical protein
MAPDPDRPRRQKEALVEIGLARLDKHSGEISFLQTVSKSQEAYEAAVRRKLTSAWKAGSFPAVLDFFA